MQRCEPYARRLYCRWGIANASPRPETNRLFTFDGFFRNAPLGQTPLGQTPLCRCALLFLVLGNELYDRRTVGTDNRTLVHFLLAEDYLLAAGGALGAVGILVLIL